MSEYVTLVGAEEVSRASYVMREAAQEMKRATGIMEAVFISHQQFLNEWLIRFEYAFTERKP